MDKILKVIPKPWGQEEILESNSNYTVKRLTMNPGKRCSYQYHEKKLETIVVLQGDLTIILNEEEKLFKPGQSITINPYEKHRMAAKNGKSVYLECSTSELDDVVRIQDDYHRPERDK